MQTYARTLSFVVTRGPLTGTKLAAVQFLLDRMGIADRETVDLDTVQAIRREARTIEVWITVEITAMNRAHMELIEAKLRENGERYTAA
jgi:hypothetical protein